MEPIILIVVGTILFILGNVFHYSFSVDCSDKYDEDEFKDVP